MHNFDKEVNRVGFGSVKWDGRQVVFGTEDVLPLSIADMDIEVPEAINEALRQRTNHPVYGYNADGPILFETIANWCERRHGWRPNPTHIVPLPGVVPGISIAIDALTKEGDGIILQTPVYPPFLGTVLYRRRRIVENRLINKDGYYTMDFDDLEEKVKDPNTTMLVLCNPHNPVGRVYTEEELTRLFQICHHHGVRVISDEIHSDVTFKGHSHKMFASLCKEAEDDCILFISISKTFNCAGLNTAYAIIPNNDLLATFKKQLATLHMERTNIFGSVATMAAYRQCDEWVDDMLAYMEGNADFVKAYIDEHMPKLVVAKPEGTYLMWVDFRAYFKENDKLSDFLVYKAKLGLNLGLPYGTPGEGFARVNIGTQRKTLEKALIQLKGALETL